MATGMASLRLAAAGFVIPYIFVFSPELLLRDVDVMTGIIVVATSLLAVLLLSTAIEGHFMENMAWYLRIVIAAGAVLLLTPNMFQDLVGAALVAIVLAVQMYKAKQNDNLSLRAI